VSPGGLVKYRQAHHQETQKLVNIMRCLAAENVPPGSSSPGT